MRRRPDAPGHALPCGKPWPDLAAYDAHTCAIIDDQVATLGLLVPITVLAEPERPGRRVFLVSRYCIAYHGVTAVQLLGGTSGFAEVVMPPSSDVTQ